MVARASRPCALDVGWWHGLPARAKVRHLFLHRGFGRKCLGHRELHRVGREGVRHDSFGGAASRKCIGHRGLQRQSVDFMRVGPCRTSDGSMRLIRVSPSQ